MHSTEFGMKKPAGLLCIHTRYDVRWQLDGKPCLRLDDRTLVIASTEDAIRIYIQTIKVGKDLLGRPKFIDTNQWRAFQGDQIVMATKARTAEEAIKLQEWIMGKPELFLVPIAPIWQDTTQEMAGIRFDDEVKVHAILIGRGAEGAERVEKVVEAARLLAVTAVQALTMQSQKGQPLQFATEVAGRILAVARTQREGVVVGLRSAVSMASVTKALPSVAAARQRAQLGQARNNLRMLAIAMYNYNNVYQHFPPAVLYGPDGKTPYSWRVAVLPFLEEEALYKQYHLDEPWDGPNNRKLLEKIPAVFRSPTESARSKSTNASYFVLAGPGTIFDGNKGTAFKEITDGLANTILLVEAKRDIPWTKPEDILYDPDKPLPELGGYFPGVVNTAFADAMVRGLPSNISDKVLRRLITKADGQAVKIPPDVP
jgi:type II secretory pathway pseudopilin PulG